MYLYSITDYDEINVLVHKNKYTQEEFEKMCKEATLGSLSGEYYYSTINIVEHLKKYGFKTANYECSFFAGQDVKIGGDKKW